MKNGIFGEAVNIKYLAKTNKKLSKLRINGERLDFLGIFVIIEAQPE